MLRQWIAGEWRQLDRNAIFSLVMLMISVIFNTMNAYQASWWVTKFLSVGVLVMLFTLFWRIVLRAYRYQKMTMLGMLMPIGTFRHYREFKQEQTELIQQIMQSKSAANTLNVAMLDAAMIEGLRSLHATVVSMDSRRVHFDS